MHEIEGAASGDGLCNASSITVEVVGNLSYKAISIALLQVANDVNVVSLPRYAVNRTGIGAPQVVSTTERIEHVEHLEGDLQGLGIVWRHRIVGSESEP